MAGQILPGRDGLIYLTDILYKLGWHATDRLALPGKNAELAIPISFQALNEAVAHSVSYDALVPPMGASQGRSFRRGGGHQWTMAGPIPLPVYPWSWIELDAP